MAVPFVLNGGVSRGFLLRMACVRDMVQKAISIMIDLFCMSLLEGSLRNISAEGTQFSVFLRLEDPEKFMEPKGTRDGWMDARRLSQCDRNHETVCHPLSAAFSSDSWHLRKTHGQMTKLVNIVLLDCILVTATLSINHNHTLSPPTYALVRTQLLYRPCFYNSHHHRLI